MKTIAFIAATMAVLVAAMVYLMETRIAHHRAQYQKIVEDLQEAVKDGDLVVKEAEDLLDVLSGDQSGGGIGHK